MPRKKRRSAWASISEPERGIFRIRFWGTDAKGTYRRMSETIRGSRKDAERRRSELMLLHSEDAPCPTVGEVWRMHVLPDMERRVEDGTLAATSLRQYQSAWSRHVAPRWEGESVEAVRPLAVQQWLDTLGRSAADMSLKVMGKVMAAAVRLEFVPTNPMRERYVLPSRTTISRRDDGIWSLAELERMRRRLDGSWYEAAFLLSAFGGLRVGEALGVRAEDVELRDVGGVPVALVRVCRQVGNRGEVTERLKTSQSRRTAMLVGMPALRLRELASALPPDWYLAHDGIGGPQTQRRLVKSWSVDGWPHPFRNLRNSWQTWMRWEARLAPWAIERLMGHKVAGVTGAYYDRPSDEVIADMLADAYRGRNWEDLGREA